MQLELTITQKKVLKALYDNRDTHLKPLQISKKSGVNLHHVQQALVKFMSNDYVYQPTIDGEFLISADGECLYFNSI